MAYALAYTLACAQVMHTVGSKYGYVEFIDASFWCENIVLGLLGGELYILCCEATQHCRAGPKLYVVRQEAPLNKALSVYRKQHFLGSAVFVHENLSCFEIDVYVLKGAHSVTRRDIVLMVFDVRAVACCPYARNRGLLCPRIDLDAFVFI